MPLWNIFHTPATFGSQDARQQLAQDITKLYTDGGLPAFYVVVQFVPLPVGNVFISAKTREGSKPFVRFVVDHMAVHRHEIGEEFTARFSDKINGALRPHVAEKGYDWEITINDVARDFWRFNGIVPPPHRSEAQQIWAANDKPTEWDNQS